DGQDGRNRRRKFSPRHHQAVSSGIIMPTAPKSARHQALVVAGGVIKFRPGNLQEGIGRQRLLLLGQTRLLPARLNPLGKEEVRIGCKLGEFLQRPTLISTPVVLTRLFSQGMLVALSGRSFSASSAQEANSTALL